jgi:hypothetical protein
VPTDQREVFMRFLLGGTSSMIASSSMYVFAYSCFYFVIQWHITLIPGKSVLLHSFASDGHN